MKCGLRLSYDQYDGVRYMLSHEIDEIRNRHVRVPLDDGTYPYFVSFH